MTYRRLIFAALRYAAACVAGCSCVGLLSGVWWWADLFNHFRPQALLVGAVLFLSAWGLRDRVGLYLALFVVGLNGALIAERLYAFPSASHLAEVSGQPSTSQTVSLLFSNVLMTNTQHEPLLDLIADQSPDIVVATEVTTPWAEALAPLDTAYPYRDISPRPDNFGMAIYAKRPFKAQRYDVGGYQLPVMVFDFGSFALLAAHPIPPISRQNAQELRLYMQGVAEVVTRANKPLILVGDFNATLWSDTLNELRGLNLVRANRAGWAWTWPSGFWPLAVQIDHIFVRDAVPVDFKTLPDIGSDHFPVRATVRFRGP